MGRTPAVSGRLDGPTGLDHGLSRRIAILNAFSIPMFHPVPGAFPSSLREFMDDCMSIDPSAISSLFETASLGAPENAVGFMLWRLVHRYVREIDRVMAPLDLTHLQFTTLALAAWLGRSGKALPQSELSRAGHIHPMQISLMLKALEAKRLIARPRSKGDTRAKTVEVTQAGLAALRRALPIAIRVQREMFGEEGSEGGALLEAVLRAEARFKDAAMTASALR
jgi:DNA-binding MarR family transcriptional regulator